MILTTGVNFLLNVCLLQQTASPLPTLNSFPGPNKAGRQEGARKGNERLHGEGSLAGVATSPEEAASLC